MKPEFERALAAEMLKKGAYNAISHTPTVRDLIAKLGQELGFNEKQAIATIRKWEDRGWYDYGVSELTGFLTPEGVEHFTKELSK